MLTVADTGAGIDADQQPLVFDRFYRATDGEEQGAGIGLAVVADLVHAHHGRLDLDSTPGRGSTFTVTVPIARHLRLHPCRRRHHRGIRPVAHR